MEVSSGSASLLTLPALSALIENTPLEELAPGDHLFRPDEVCVNLPVVVMGIARVYVRNEHNRQVTLYQLRPGAICPLSLSTLLQNSLYPAGAIAETRVQLRYLPGEKLKPLIQQSREASSALLDTIAGSLYEAIRTARSLMFAPLDMRLAQLLRNRFATAPDEVIHLTHEQLANELGTTRVVVSRLLKRLEHSRCIQLRRREIVLTDPEALENIIAPARKPAARAGAL